MDNPYNYQWNRIEIPEKTLEIWQNIINSLAEIFEVPAALIMRVHPPTIEVFISSHTKGNPYEKGEQANLPGLYCNHVMNTNKPLLIPNATKDPNWDQNPDIKLGMISYLGYPINWSNGDIFGTICVLDSKEIVYTKKHTEILKHFKLMIENYLELTLLNNKLNQKNLELEKSLGVVNNLKNLLPICIKCKKIREDEGYWTEIEEFFKTHADINFSHVVCNKCFKEIYPDYADQVLNTPNESK